MKFLEHSHFEALNTALNFDAGIYRIIGRLESYSCKLVASEKKLFKTMNAQDGLSPNDLEALSPPISSSFTSRIENMADELQWSQTSRKTLFYLIATLNASFNPDYDFSHCRGDEFSKEPSIKCVMDQIDSNFFSNSSSNQYIQIKSQLWAAVDSHINLSDPELEIYSFKPNSDFDLWDEPCIWSYYYFFYSKKLKRVVFFTYRAVRKEEEADADEQDTGYISFAMDI